MNFNHLEYIDVVARYGSISKASQELLVSQPYLSGMIKNLEEELGYPIFLRDRNGISLTERGKLFLNSSRIILQELEHIRSYRYETAVLPLRIATYYATGIMNCFLRFQNAYPNTSKNRIHEMGNYEVISAIVSGRYNLGFIFYSQSKEEKYLNLLEEHKLHSRPLFDSIPSYVILSKTHPACDFDRFTLDMLKQYPYVAYDDSSSVDYLKLLGLDQHQTLLHVSSRAGFYDALRSGAYLSMMALFDSQKMPDFHYIPITDSHFYINARIVTRQNYTLLKSEQDFLEFLKRESTLSRR